ncbi:hypothetical protein [Clostridium gasigenes]|uniref:Uncharacterized protein n=1 Tax=Clostridium gasigenes TaxID=94869 RepID=A0A7X0VTP6_9CLOT|nr:hypothetical protein [Clostridium gasigenes]MBB6715756.1 hypothetical protein [Clostridium gasigenes]
MNESNLKLAQQDIDDALQTVADMEEIIDANEVSKEILKEKFISLTDKVQELEDILKTEGIL